MKKLQYKYYLFVLLSMLFLVPDVHAQYDTPTNASVGVSGGIGFGYEGRKIITRRPPKSLFLDIYAGPSFIISMGMSGYHAYEYRRDSVPDDIVLSSVDLRLGWNKQNKTGGLFGGSGIGVLAGYGIKNYSENITPLIPLRIGTYTIINFNLPVMSDFFGRDFNLSPFVYMEGSALFFSRKKVQSPTLLGEMLFGLRVTALEGDQ